MLIAFFIKKERIIFQIILCKHSSKSSKIVFYHFLINIFTKHLTFVIKIILPVVKNLPPPHMEQIILVDRVDRVDTVLPIYTYSFGIKTRLMHGHCPRCTPCTFTVLSNGYLDTRLFCFDLADVF